MQIQIKTKSMERVKVFKVIDCQNFIAAQSLAAAFFMTIDRNILIMHFYRKAFMRSSQAKHDFIAC